ncbi:MAG: hypothetical protein IJS90_06995 [Clostridia bacterium]|nr:hypothetical protein [Clostridia bacterium]
MKDKKLKIGFNSFDNHVLGGDLDFDGIIEKAGGVDFVLCHFEIGDGKLSSQLERAKKVAERMKELKTPFIANFETQNFRYDCSTEEGHDWANHPDGTHRLNIPKEMVAALNSEKGLAGIMYDEFEHTIINRNISIFMDSKMKLDVPVFNPFYTDSVRVEGEALSSEIKEYADSIKALGAPAFAGEHVFPVLFHTFARNGVTPNFKSQKESCSNVQFAIAAGAALQYGTELWNCVDLWHKMTFPGHSATEMYNNLLFAFLTGVNRVYVEASSGFVSKVNGSEVINEYGEEYCRFVKEYKDKERSYTVLDYKPEIGVIRYDNGYWGQGGVPLPWRNELLGSKYIKPDFRAKEFIKVMHLITHGETSPNSLTWSRIEPFSLTPHRSFTSMNGAAVFDDRVTADKLTSLRLCFLCGEYISEQTLKDVKKLVNENGLTVVTPRRFAPKGIKNTAQGCLREFKDGKGTWIICENFSDPRLKKRVMPFLGNKGEMKFRFGSETVTLKISPDANEITRI